MKLYYPLALFMLMVVVACNLEKLPPAEDAIEAARGFEDGCLKGDFDKAKFYLVSNISNLSKLQVIEKKYNNKTAEQQKQLSETSIVILAEWEINKTVHCVVLHNSYDKKNDTLNVVQQNNNWLVNLK